MSSSIQFGDKNNILLTLLGVDCSDCKVIFQ